jgi:hypothetical protein
MNPVKNPLPNKRLELGLANVRIRILSIERQNTSSQLPIFALREHAHLIGQQVDNSSQSSGKVSFQMSVR